MLVGARVTSTIKDGIIPAAVFKGNAGVQLLAFVCAIVSSSSEPYRYLIPSISLSHPIPAWLSIATRLSWPVSTTYSIVSSVIGVGIAAGGFDAPAWGWNKGKGVATIFAGFAIGMPVHPPSLNPSNFLLSTCHRWWLRYCPLLPHQVRSPRS